MLAGAAPGAPRNNFFEEAKGNAFTKNQRFPPSPALRHFEQELAYYRADESILTVEKCAERCRRLSQLLTEAARGTAITKS